MFKKQGFYAEIAVTLVKSVDIVQVCAQKLKNCSDYFDCRYLSKSDNSFVVGRSVHCARGYSGVNDGIKLQFVGDLFNPFFHALGGQLRLAVFIDSQTNEMVVVGQAF